LAWAANIFELLLLGTGVVLLVRQSLRERGQPPEHVAPWRVHWTDFVLWLCLIAFVVIAGEILMLSIYPMDPKGDLTPTDKLVLGGAQQVFILLAQLGILWSKNSFSPAPLNREKLTLPRIIAQGARAFVTAIPLIVIASLAWGFVLDGVQQLFPHLRAAPQSVVQIIADKPDLGIISLTILFAVALAPVNEELLFRAGLYRFLKGKFPRRVALGAASFVFAAAHYNLYSFVPLFVVGWLLARTYERSGHIGVSMVFHALFNLNTIVMFVIFPGQL